MKHSLQYSNDGSLTVELLLSVTLLTLFTAVISQALSSEQQIAKHLIRRRIISENETAAIEKIEGDYETRIMPHSLVFSVRRPMSPRTNTTIYCDGHAVNLPQASADKVLYLICSNESRCSATTTCSSSIGSVAWNLR